MSDMSSNIILVILVTSLATYLSRFLGVVSSEKIDEANHFIEKNKSIIHNQYEMILKLDREIRDTVISNKEKQQADESYKKLMEKEEFKKIASDIKKMKAALSNLKVFLAQRGVTGYQV